MPTKRTQSDIPTIIHFSDNTDLVFLYPNLILILSITVSPNIKMAKTVKNSFILRIYCHYKYAIRAEGMEY